MIECNIHCERCEKFMGTMMNPIHLRGWYCNKCIAEMEEERDNHAEEQRKYYDEDDFWKLE